MIERPFYINKLRVALSRSPIVALLGPRQVGKTTLAKTYAEEKQATFFDLESEPDLQQLANPELVLGNLEGLIVIDEIQVMPQLFNTLRVLVDRSSKAHFLILGSASPELIRHTSQSLAGRIEFIELPGFSLEEINKISWRKLWVRGGYPRSLLAQSNTDSSNWREGFTRTFLERDIPQLGISIPSVSMRRFWSMLAHLHGKTWNATEISRSMGLSDKTVRSYLDILTGTFMVRQLQPWYVNVSKRQVKAQKIYFRDSGLLHHLLNISTSRDLLSHPVVGSSWEGFALEEVLKALSLPEAYYWATYSGAELDVLFIMGGQRFGIEMKFAEAPKPTKSMYTAINDLHLKHLWVVHPGTKSYPIETNITSLSIEDVPNLPALLNPAG